MSSDSKKEAVLAQVREVLLSAVKQARKVRK